MKLSPLEKCVASTLAYYKALGNFPLTSFEVSRRLNKEDSNQTYSYREILDALASMEKRRVAREQNGFFYIPNNKKGKDAPVANRIERYKTSIGKQKRLAKALWFLQTLPFITMVGITGSLSLRNASRESDIDLLVIAQAGRIWTSRVLCSVTTHILGMRRYQNNVKDRICLNHYISNDSLTLKVKNLSNAHTYASLIPVIDKGGWYQEFQKNNDWMNTYLSHRSWRLDRSLQYPKKNPARFLSSLFELLFRNRIGDLFERLSQYLQEGKILKHISEIRSIHDNQLILSNETLMFHYPVSRNEEVEKQYKKEMEKLEAEGQGSRTRSLTC